MENNKYDHWGIGRKKQGPGCARVGVKGRMCLRCNVKGKVTRAQSMVTVAQRVCALFRKGFGAKLPFSLF